jgi:hypothetical protein
MRSPSRTAVIQVMTLSILFAATAAAQPRRESLQASKESKTCQEFRSLSQQTFDNAVGGYSGPAFAVLDGEVLIDPASIPFVIPPTTSCNGRTCTDRDAQYRLNFGNGDTLTYETIVATYPQPPTFGTYRSTNRIVGGTGRFQNATGTLLEYGPFLAWIDAQGQLQARYSGEITGKICGVEPKGSGR